MYSEPGLGSTFKIYLPRVGAGRTIAANGTHPDATRAAGDHPIVEDEEMVRSLASRALRELGYRVVEARHGTDALRQLAVQVSAAISSSPTS